MLLLGKPLTHPTNKRKLDRMFRLYSREEKIKSLGKNKNHSRRPRNSSKMLKIRKSSACPRTKRDRLEGRRQERKTSLMRYLRNIRRTFYPRLKRRRRVAKKAMILKKLSCLIEYPICGH